MVLIFTDTTSLLSAEFVSTFSAEKLAITLFRISQDTGVEFCQAQKSFSIIGDWNKVLQAHSCLEEYFAKEQRAQQEEQRLCNERVHQNHNVCNESKRGRKPGCTVAKNSYDAVPEPQVQFLNDQGLPVNVTKHKKGRAFTKVESDDKNTENEKAQNVSDENDASEKDNHSDTNKDNTERADCFTGNGENIMVKEEFNEDAMDEDTDVDEQFLEKSDINQPANIEPGITIKIEKDLLAVEVKGKSKSRRKSRPKKLASKKNFKKEAKQLEKKLPMKTDKSKGKSKVLVKQDGGLKIQNKQKDKTERKKQEDKEFKCDQCEYIGKKKENLREHTQRMHRNKFKCETCSKQFGLHKDLLRHTRHVHTNPAFHCKICDKFYKFNRAYKEHMLSHEENYVKPQFECEICHKVFSTKYVLTGHVKSEHLGMKKSFMCPTCGRSFTQKNSYLMHANVHAGIKPYVCDVCGKAFSYDKSLKEHKYMHDDERRFSCDVCAKTFRQKTSLLMHMKVHKEARDYICTSCGKGFTQKQALLRHERIHSGDKPFKCALCQRAFNDYSIIRRHMMMHHKRDKDPKTWRGDIICSLKRKTEFYIEGGPGYNGGDRLPTVEVETEAGTCGKTVSSEGNSLENSVLTSDETEDATLTNKEDSFVKLESSAPVTQSNRESIVASNTETATSLPDCSGVHPSYNSQEITVSSDAMNKLQDSDPAVSHSLPINYSLPTSYQHAVQTVPVTSGPNSDSDDIQRQFQEMMDYRIQGQRREMFMQNLTAMAPLPALAQNHQLPTVSGDTTQGQPLPGPWSLAGYPHYYSHANFSHYQGPQS